MNAMTSIFFPQTPRYKQHPYFQRLLQASALILGLGLTLTLTACKSTSAPEKRVHANETFTTDTPFSYASKRPPEAACETGKHALLSQGYRISEDKTLSLNGEKIFRPETERVVRLGINLVCLASGRGAIIYANALETHYELKSSGSSAGVSVSGMGSLSLPWTMDRNTLVKISEETITNAGFYQRLFDLIESLEGGKKATPAADDAP